MRLQPGSASSEAPNRHPQSDQVLLLLEGTLRAEIGESHQALRQGDVVIVPANTPHRFVNDGAKVAVSFNVYGPPAY